LDGRQIFRRECSEPSSLDTKGEMPSKFQWSHWCHLSKITKAERVKEMVLMHVWLSGIKALPDTNSYF
jgi:hypothetical protein